MLDQASSSALLALYTVRTVALVLLAVGLGLVCLVAGLHTHHKYRQLQDGVDAGETSILGFAPLSYFETLVVERAAALGVDH
jgi:hypothetical protein